MDRSYSTQPTPQGRKKIYNIDSRMRTNASVSSSSGEFTVDVGAFDGPVQTIELVSAEIPNTQYVFTSANNYIDFNEGAGALSAQITPGTYSIDDLVSHLKTILDAAGSDTYTVSFDEITKKLTIASTGSFSLLWSSGSHSATSAYKELGWNQTDVSSGSSHTAPNSLKISGDDYWFISVRNMPLNGVQGGSNSIGFTFKVPINVGYGDIVFYTQETGLNQTITQANVCFCQPIFYVQLLDAYGKIVDLQGRDWSCAIGITTYRSNY